MVMISALHLMERDLIIFDYIISCLKDGNFI